MNYIFDIDGTLADCSHRLHFIQGESKDWDSFHKECVDDKPIQTNIYLLRSILWASNDNILFLTGRPESSRHLTIQWIMNYCSILTNKKNMFMRKDGDHREDWVIKLEHLNNLNLDKSETIIFDDRDQVVQNLRREGWTVFQVKNGEY